MLLEGSSSSIQKPELPLRNAVVVAHLRGVHGKITVWNILDLVESLVLSVHFKQMPAIDEKRLSIV